MIRFANGEVLLTPEELLILKDLIFNGYLDLDKEEEELLNKLFSENDD